MGMFFEEHAKLLSDFARVSQAAGARADYVQGGGGNTSVKLPGGLMAIKASGFCLSDIRPDKAYAVLDGADLRNFYLTTEPSALADVEKEGSARAKADIRHIDGLADLRPSVEAGFHSILKTFVVHTHSVYANLAACSTACRPIAAQAFAGANYTWGWVPYTDPGANLTFAIRDELRRVEAETGKAPSVILMQNHGIIVHDDDPDTALAIHTDAKRAAGTDVRPVRYKLPEDRRARNGRRHLRRRCAVSGRSVPNRRLHAGISHDAAAVSRPDGLPDGYVLSGSGNAWSRAGRRQQQNGQSCSCRWTRKRL